MGPFKMLYKAIWGYTDPFKGYIRLRGALKRATNGYVGTQTIRILWYLAYYARKSACTAQHLPGIVPRHTPYHVTSLHLM